MEELAIVYYSITVFTCVFAGTILLGIQGFLNADIPSYFVAKRCMAIFLVFTGFGIMTNFFIAHFVNIQGTILHLFNLLVWAVAIASLFYYFFYLYQINRKSLRGMAPVVLPALLLLFCSCALCLKKVMLSFAVHGIWAVFLFAALAGYCVIGFINYFQKRMSVGDVRELLQGSEEVESEEENSVNTVMKDDGYYYAKAMVNRWLEKSEKSYLASGLTLSDVAAEIGISKRRLSEYINSEYQMNFNTWINVLRIEVVEKVLQNSEEDKALADIAVECGFCDLARMSNAFKKMKGISPSQYKKEMSKVRV